MSLRILVSASLLLLGANASAASLTLCGETVIQPTCTGGTVLAAAGQSITVQIQGSGFDVQTAGGDFSLSFDPAKLSLVSFVVANPPFDTFSVNETDVATGLLNRVDVFKSTAGNVGPDFDVATATFNVLGTGTTIQLASSLVGWFDADGLDPYTVDYGSLQVNAVPAPAAIWLLGTALGGLAVRRLRKTA